jgi:hypothetical protein
VIGCGQILVSDFLGRLREFAYGGRIAANSDIDKGQRDAKFHLDYPLAVAQPVRAPHPSPDSYTSAERRAISERFDENRSVCRCTRWRLAICRDRIPCGQRVD